jgi:hypothetical protein
MTTHFLSPVEHSEIFSSSVVHAEVYASAAVAKIVGVHNI